MHIGTRNVVMGRRGMVGRPSAAWTPASLGASLLAWWDAERSDLITQSGGLVSSWKDVVGGYDLTATTTAQPAYGATSFNGRPGITFDGVANTLTLLTGLGFLPIGSAGSEDWYVFDQPVPAGTAGTRNLGSWGSGSANNSRSSHRTVLSTVNRARVSVGSGAAATVAPNSVVDFSGRAVVRAVVTPTQSSVEINGIGDTPTAVVPATVAGRLRIGADASAAPAGFGLGTLSARLITGPLTTQQAGQLNAWLSGRL